MGGLEEFFEILWSDVEGIARRFFGGSVSWTGKFDGTDGTKGTFITEDEVDGFVLDEAFGSLAVLRANFVVEECGDFDLGDDVELFAKKFDQELEAEFFWPLHKTFSGAIASAGFETLTALADADTGENGHEKQGYNSDSCGSQVDFVRAKESFNVHINFSRNCHLL